MKYLVILLSLTVLSKFSSAQVMEEFNDGELDTNPTWTGTSSSWIINPLLQLQSNHTISNSSFYVSTLQQMVVSVQWELFIKLQFNPSSANYVDVYLVSQLQDLSQANNSGYFVRIGNTQDEISLYRKDGGTSTKIIDGIDGITNNIDNTIRLKVVRDNANQFFLFRDMSGTGSQFVLEGSVTDGNIQSCSYFGIYVRQSTSSFFQKHFFDEIRIGSFIPDTSAPEILSAEAISAQAVEIKFNEPMHDTSSLQPLNYLVSHNIGQPLAISFIDPSTLRLSFSQNFENGINYELKVKNLKDLSGNILANATRNFQYYTAGRFDIIFHEIMADPSPPSGLPNADFIEIKNRSGQVINLEGWKVGYNGVLTGELPAIKIFADSILLVVSTAHIPLFSPFGKVAGVTSFPGLANEKGILSLYNKEGKTIHSIEYSDEWYGNEIKKSGGWTLEMIDQDFPCLGLSNWKASTHSSGGTPGKENSVKGNISDEIPPKLLRTYSMDSLTVLTNPLTAILQLKKNCMHWNP